MDPITKALLAEFVQQQELTDLPEDVQFEMFATFSVLASRYNEEFEPDSVVLGGSNDLGVDGCGIILNGRLVEDAQEVEDILSVNGYLEAEFIFVQAKRSQHFDGAAMLALGQQLRSAVFLKDSAPPISDNLRNRVEIIDAIYKNAARFRGNPECRVYYVTTGTWKDEPYLKEIVGKQIADLLGTSMFRDVKYLAIGARGLQDLYRSTKFSIERQITFDRTVVLPGIEKAKASYLGVLPASEFIKLITDDDDNIVKSVFIDNVRDYQGENPVNESISKTIEGGLLDQFVLRNNGVTIVTRNLSITGQAFTIRDYQIVNGCQSSHVLYANRLKLTDSLFVPIKLIYTDDEQLTQDVTKSTNSQTPIDENDLLALTQFQRDLETFYSGTSGDSRLYYERRSKQYAGREDVDRPRIIPVGIQLKVFASMFLDTPHQAGRYQATLLKSVGDRVFKAGHRPEPYYASALAYYRFENLIRRGHAGAGDMRSFRFHLLSAFRYRFGADVLPKFEEKSISKYSDELVKSLADWDKSKAIFESCVDIVRRAVASKGLQVVRDVAKVRDVTDAVRELASKERQEAAAT